MIADYISVLTAFFFRNVRVFKWWIVYESSSVVQRLNSVIYMSAPVVHCGGLLTVKCFITFPVNV